MSITGKIILPNNIQIYAGNNINLSIEIQNPEKIFLKAIFLNFRGEINVQWEDLINKPKDGKIIYVMQKFEGQEICINQQITLQTMDVLNKGKHIYNKQLKIPNNLPQTVNRRYGSVNYELELIVHKTTGRDIIYKMPVIIKKYRNIGITKEDVPFHTVFRKYFCWGFCNSKPLKVWLTLPTTSVTAGQSIKYFIILQNFSKYLDLQRLTAILTQTLQYKALKPKTRIKQVHTTLNLMMHHFTNNHHHNSKFEGSLKLPQTLEPSSQEIGLIMYSYYLKFILVFKGFQTDGYISIPIVVGSHNDDTKKIWNYTTSETKLQIEDELKNEYEV